MSTIKATNIQPQSDSDPLVFSTNATERMRIPSSGGVSITGGATVYGDIEVFDGAFVRSGGLSVTGSASISQNMTVGSNLTVGSSTLSAPSGTAPLFGIRAWGRFVGAGTGNPTGVIGGNISTTITRASSAIYQVTFTTAMPNTTYAVIFGGSNALDGFGLFTIVAGTKTTSGFQIRSQSGTTPADLNTTNECFFAVLT